MKAPWLSSNLYFLFFSILSLSVFCHQYSVCWFCEIQYITGTVITYVRNHYEMFLASVFSA